MKQHLVYQKEKKKKELSRRVPYTRTFPFGLISKSYAYVVVPHKVAQLVPPFTTHHVINSYS